MKKLLFSIALISAMYCCPVYGQDNVNVDETVTAAQFENLLNEVTDTRTMYSTVDGLNIRTEPNTESEILGQAYLNTSFETVLEINGWTMITTNDGYAYIKSDYLSDTETPIKLYTDDELYIMAHLLAGECQEYSDEEQRYVGSVALNRIKHPLYPDDLESVVFQKGQYSCTRDGNYYRTPTDRNWANAKWLLENGSVLPSNVIYQSGDKQGSGVYLKTKWHYYCY